jgi:hypothetical protein
MERAGRAKVTAVATRERAPSTRSVGVSRSATILTTLLLAVALSPAAASAAPLTWTKQAAAIDGFKDANGISCPTPTLCVVMEEDGRIAVSTNPAADAPAWATYDLPATPLSSSGDPAWFEAVACRTAQLCMATSRLGDMFVANDPATKASWTKSVFANGPYYGRDIERLSCQTSAPCVGHDSGNRQMLITPAPEGGAGTWTADSFDYSFNTGDVSCMAGPVCIAASGPHMIHTTQPGGGADKWTVVNNVGNQFDGSAQRDTLDSVECAGNFCLAGGHGTAGKNGGLYWSTNPTGDVTAWSSFASFFREVSRLACSPSGERCVAWAADGPFIFDSTNPMGGKSAWSLANPAIANSYVGEVSCPDVSICFAISLSGYLSVGKDNFTGDTGQPISNPNPDPTPTPAPSGSPVPSPTPSPTPAPSIYAGIQFGTAPTGLDAGGNSMSMVIHSASDAQATIRILSTQPIVIISAKKKIETFGTAKATLKANVNTKVKIKLSKKAKRYFKRHAKVKVKIEVKATTPAGITKTTSKTTTIKRRKKG